MRTGMGTMGIALNTMTMRTFWVVWLVVALTGRSAWAGDEVVQIDVRSILTGRAVTTLTNGKLVPWSKGIDGWGKGDGYMTQEASVANGDKDAHALPGDGCFAATASHPFVRLNFSNADGTGPQTRNVEGAGGFSFAVPRGRYDQMMVFLTSAAGPSQLRFRLVYADGAPVVREVLLPDYYNDPPAGSTNVFSLAGNLAKWDADGHMAERDHHNIHGVRLYPDGARELVSVEVSKSKEGYLVFWGASGACNHRGK